MARNLFGVGDVLAAGQQGWDDTQAKISGIENKATAYRAGRAYAGGDRQGAAAALAQGGNIQGARTIQNDIQGDERQAMLDRNAAEQQTYQRGRDQRTDARQDKTDQRQDREEAIRAAQERFSILEAVGGSVMKEPLGSRKAKLHRGLELFAQVGYPPEVIDQLRNLNEDQLTDDGILATIATGKEELVKLSGGGLGTWNPQTHKYTELVKPNLKLSQGQVAYDAEGNLIANNPKTYAPQRSGGAGGLSAMSNEDLIKALRGGR